MGDHTDYHDGFVLPVAIDRETVVGFRPTTDGHVRLRSLDLDGAVNVSADGTADPAAVEPPWGRMVAAVVRALATRGRSPVGIDGALVSTVPIGAGLSSSAALAVAVAGALCDAAAMTLPPAELARVAQDAEHQATGVPCGIMDQLASVAGRAGHALLIDCRSLAVTPVPVPDDVAIVIVHSGAPRALATSEYAHRRAACDDAARSLALPALRDATLDQVADSPLARHVVTENARVTAMASALAAGDRVRIAALMAASHESLRDDFAVSTPALDEIVETLVGAGAIGARLTGAGFGGCVVALVDRGRLEDVLGAVPGYEAFVCTAADGASGSPVST